MHRVLIITAVFNRANYVIDAINSLQNQTYPNITHVIIDGGSTDGTLDIIRNHMTDNIVLVSERDNGIYDALNKGLSYAKNADIIGVLHSDDFFSDNKVIEKVVNVFQNKKPDIVHGDLQYVKAQTPSKVIRSWRSSSFSSDKLRWGWMPPHPTVFLTNEMVTYMGRFDLRYQIASDYDAILRCYSRTGIVSHYIPEVLVKMRTGGISNGSIGKIIQKSYEDYSVIRRNNIGGLLTLFAKNLRKIGQFRFGVKRLDAKRGPDIETLGN